MMERLQGDHGKEIPALLQLEPRARFLYLDFLRFIFAMLVFFGHMKSFFCLPNAALAVDYFFLLSGFVLAHAYQDKLSSRRFFLQFTRDRFARLYPLHFATIFILMFMNVWFNEIIPSEHLEQGWSYQDGRAYTLLLNLSLLNNIGLTSGGPSWNAPAWSISVEFWTNIALAMAAAISRKYAPVFYICAFAFVYGLIAYFGVTPADFYINIGSANSGLLRGIAGISAGVLCYACYLWALRSPYLRKSRLSVAALVSILAQLVLFSTPIHPSQAELLVLPISGLVVTVIALFESLHQRSRVDALLQWLGECSYGIYMTHWMVLTFVNYFLIHAWHRHIDLKNPVHFASVMVFVILAARASFNFIEQPGKRLIKYGLMQPGRRAQ